MMHVLHICSDYSRQKLYSELILELSKTDIQQTVYVPVRSAMEVGKYDVSGLPNISVIYAHILTKKHRILYHLKVKSILANLQSKIDLDSIDLVHAHFLFSDGGVAYQIKQKHGIPYVVAVRNTDVNIFFKYMLHLRGLGRKILNAAQQVMFVTPAYRALLAQKYIPLEKSNRILTAPVIPNGLKPEWLENPIQNDGHVLYPLKLLYVGDFTHNKNILHLLKVVKKLTEKVDVKLTLAGGGGDGHESVLRMTRQKGFQFVNYIGRVEGMEAMKELYRQHHIFIMISKFETFGLVYLEAMSQGLPVVHTAGQGIDGYFKNSNFAVPVEANGMEEIVKALEKIMGTYKNASQDAVIAAKSFSWPEIARKYSNLYLEKSNT
jgi:glycosyltransferase involved in cell wall biosynthesis